MVGYSTYQRPESSCWVASWLSGLVKLFVRIEAGRAGRRHERQQQRRLTTNDWRRQLHLTDSSSKEVNRQTSSQLECSISRPVCASICLSVCDRQAVVPTTVFVCGGNVLNLSTYRSLNHRRQTDRRTFREIANFANRLACVGDSTFCCFLRLCDTWGNDGLFVSTWRHR